MTHVSTAMFGASQFARAFLRFPAKRGEGEIFHLPRFLNFIHFESKFNLPRNISNVNPGEFRAARVSTAWPN